MVRILKNIHDGLVERRDIISEGNLGGRWRWGKIWALNAAREHYIDIQFLHIFLTFSNIQWYAQLSDLDFITQTICFLFSLPRKKDTTRK